jgi:hypothetical protein
MRSAGNFHPEWGYLAPAPSFVRTLRIVLVATAIGATAGAAVVVSLVARPGSSSADSSIAAHALVAAPAVHSASAAVVLPAQQAAPAPAAAIAAAPVAAAPAGPSGEIAGASGNPSGGAPPQMANAPDLSSGVAPAHTAHIEEPAAAPVHEDTAIAPEGGANKKAAAKKHRVAGYETMRRWQSRKPRRNGGGGFEPLFRLFSSRNGSPFSTY